MNNPVYSLSNFIGDFPFTIDGVISFACKYYPNKEAVVAQNSSLTYSNLNNAINNFAFTLQKNGIKRYDRIALVLSNTPEFVIGLFGIRNIYWGGLSVNQWLLVITVSWAAAVLYLKSDLKVL